LAAVAVLVLALAIVVVTQPPHVQADRSRPAGFQNPDMAFDQRFHAVDSYSLIGPPSTGRRRILPWIGSGDGRLRGAADVAAARDCGRRVL
jgi:hypothetical protein